MVAQDIIADFGNLKQYIGSERAKDTQNTLLKCIYLPKTLLAQSSPLHIKPRISVGGSVWRIWVGLQAVNALAISKEQGLNAPIAPVLSGIVTSVTSAIVAFMIVGIIKE